MLEQELEKHWNRKRKKEQKQKSEARKHIFELQCINCDPYTGFKNTDAYAYMRCVQMAWANVLES